MNWFSRCRITQTNIYASDQWDGNIIVSVFCLSTQQRIPGTTTLLGGQFEMVKAVITRFLVIVGIVSTGLEQFHI